MVRFHLIYKGKQVGKINVADKSMIIDLDIEKIIAKKSKYISVNLPLSNDMMGIIRATYDNVKANEKAELERKKEEERKRREEEKAKKETEKKAKEEEIKKVKVWRKKEESEETEL